jgi:hypothetical protein
MERDGWRGARKAVNAAGILDFFKYIPRGSRLWKRAKAGPCVCKSPAWQLNR